MEKQAKFISLRWVVTEAYYQYGFTPPKYALKNRNTLEYIRGDDGSFLTREPNRLILTVQTEDGHKFSEDIMGYVKYVCGKIRVTKKVRQKLERTFATWPFKVYTHRDGKPPTIYGIYDAIRAAIK